MKKWTALLTLGLFFGDPGFAQEVAGHLEGRLVDSSGTAITGANVFTTSKQLQGIRGTVSDQSGFFRLLYLTPGLYRLNIRHVAFEPVQIENVRISLGRTTGLGTIIMGSKNIDKGATVITARRNTLDPAATSIGMNMVRENFESLPIDRNYRSIASLLPHANSTYLGDEVNISGASGSENHFFIDGIDTRDPYRGATGTNLPYNFVREIQVKQGGYEAEYKSALGGVINAITFSGGNTFSGQIFGFFTNNNFSNQPRVAETETPKGDFAQYDAGLVFGGPLLRDRLWFSLAYNPSIKTEQIKVPGFNYYPDKTVSHPFAGKITWKANESLDFTATVIGDPTKEQAVCKNTSVGVTLLGAENPDFFLQEITTGGYGVVLKGNYFLSPRMLMKSSLSWSRRFEKYMPRTQRGWEDFWVFDAVHSTAAGGTGERLDVNSSTFSFETSITRHFNRHLFKTGVEYKEIDLNIDNIIHCLNVWNESSYLAYIMRAKGLLKNRLPSLYIDDTWNMTKRITLKGGIRWDGIFIYDSKGNQAQSILGQYQPRLASAYMLSEKSKFTVAAGRYADDLMMFGSTLYHLGGYQLGLAWDHDPRIAPGKYDASDADTSFYLGGKIAPAVKNLKGHYFDELSLGYEHLFSRQWKFTSRGIYRVLRNILEDGEAPEGSFIFQYANPGSGPLSEYPKATRIYRALELTLEASPSDRLNLMASYVLSSNRGNWSGIFYQDFRWAMPNCTPQFDFVEVTRNAEGLLPNDRTHVFKLNGSYDSGIGLSGGFSFIWQSGTPLSEFGNSSRVSGSPVFLVPRGTAGRLPSLWDLNLRLSYDLGKKINSRFSSRLIADIFHIGSQRTVVQQDQWHYFTQDSEGRQTDPNPAYGMPQRFQPPTSVRLGMEIDF